MGKAIEAFATAEKWLSPVNITSVTKSKVCGLASGPLPIPATQMTSLCTVLPQLLQMFYRQQEEIRRLRELLIQREVQTKQLELEIKNLRMVLGQF